MKKLLPVMLFLLLVGLLLVSCTGREDTPPVNLADRPYVAFSLFKYTDYSDQLCQLDAGKDKKVNLKDLIGANDEAKAGMLYGCYKGTIISVFDD